MKSSFLNDVSNIILFTVLALSGIVARQAHAAAAAGKMNWSLLGVYCLTAPALGIIAGGFAQWLNVPSAAEWAIVALVGLMGPAFVITAGERAFDLWFKKSGG